MARVTVLVLHLEPSADAGPLTQAVAAARLALADVHRAAFLAAGADEARIVSGPPDGSSFGARLRALAAPIEGGLVLLGSGSLPLATPPDRARLIATAATGAARALANNRYSADVLAIGRADVLTGLPDLDADNALPRWLEERAGVPVADLRGRWDLAVDLDGPLDLVLAARHRAAPATLGVHARAIAAAAPGVSAAIAAVARVMADRRAELLVAGRTSAATLRWLERGTAARIRALVEERGLRASTPLAMADAPEVGRPPSSILGLLLERDGPAAIAGIVRRLADAAIVDSRVLLAHRLGPDERGWPSPEDRFASDLLRPDLVADPWLRGLTRAAAEAPVPILLGGHTLVGPGVRLIGLRPA